MKGIFYLFVISLLISCTKSEDTNTENQNLVKFIGSWSLSEILVSDGGTENWVTPPENMNHTISFNENGNYVFPSNDTNCQNGTYVSTDTTININPNSDLCDDGILNYLLRDNTTLEIVENGTCVEACARRYIKIVGE